MSHDDGQPNRRARIARHDRIWAAVCAISLVPLAVVSLILHGSIL